MNQNKQEQINKIKVSLKGELDSSNVDGDILYYNELSRGRVLNRLYKLFSKELAKVEQRARQEAVEDTAANERIKMMRVIKNVLEPKNGSYGEFLYNEITKELKALSLKKEQE